MLAVGLGAGAQVVASTRVSTQRGGLDVLASIVEVVAAVAGPGGPTSIGIGVPGGVDAAGVLRFSPHLPGLVGLPLAGHLAGHFPDRGVWVGNDATAAVWAEHRAGSAVGVDEVLMVTLGTGIGGGMVSGGVLREGAHRFAGEFGHMVVDPHGPPCPCGKQGCWERFASGTGLGQLGREAALAGRATRVRALAGDDPEAVRGEHVTTAAAAGDAEALAIMGHFAWWLALGLANLANVCDPEVIVLGGGLIGAGEVLLSPVRTAFSQLVEADDHRRVRIVAAGLGEMAGAIGAALCGTGAEAPAGRRPLAPPGQ